MTEPVSNGFLTLRRREKLPIRALGLPETARQCSVKGRPRPNTAIDRFLPRRGAAPQEQTLNIFRHCNTLVVASLGTRAFKTQLSTQK